MTKEWIPVGLSDLLRSGGVFRTWIAGDEIAVWRSAKGKVHAWDNRCPHRGMRLHHGFVRGEQLACLYHGWHYDGDGACSYIPAHPELEPPASICVPITACVEAGGIVWAGGNGTEPPNLPEGFGVAVRSLHVACPVNLVMDAIGGSMAVVNAGDQRAAAIVQPLPDAAVLHILAADAASQDELQQVAAWAVSFRDSLEAGEVAP